MTLVPISLSPLKKEFVSQMYERARSNEAVFRNILIHLSDSAEEAQFFRTGNLDDIFNKYVNVGGFETRVSDFRVGPFVLDDVFLSCKFPRFKPESLAKNNAFVLIEQSNDSWLRTYEFSSDSSVKPTQSVNYHQF